MDLTILGLPVAFAKAMISQHRRAIILNLTHLLQIYWDYNIRIKILSRH